MVDLPWSRGGRETGEDGTDPVEEHADAIVVCAFQDGTLSVYEDRVVIERAGRSKFDDKTISSDEIRGVDYSEGITIGYLQIEQTGVEVDAGGLLSDPVNENTLHFGRGNRECAREAREEILGQARA
ncbi:hypothetical protein [Halococcus saccharolyticus]|uniref:YokE-like PH domain-containing protein n=1 Tax=Halococcus saccharolyticus DSM 5350 TaxID=1227455 RepID=M0MDA3_9EURY|nr:hypothetical protein [Halococcus saccharolyticus]EMA43752.1 hypothetical protein C449_13072 [Halococcus saccharolyticus DSM 5350]